MSAHTHTHTHTDSVLQRECHTYAKPNVWLRKRWCWWGTRKQRAATCLNLLRPQPTSSNKIYVYENHLLLVEFMSIWQIVFISGLFWNVYYMCKYILHVYVARFLLYYYWVFVCCSPADLDWVQFHCHFCEFFAHLQRRNIGEQSTLEMPLGCQNIHVLVCDSLSAV